MKYYRGKIPITTVVGLTAIAFTAMTTIASPGRQVQRSEAAPQLTHSLPRPPRAFLVPATALPELQPANAIAPPVVPSATSPPSIATSVTSGTWAPLNNQPSFSPGSAFLLTDGTVLVQDQNLTTRGWWKLTPDNTGSYINGAWIQVASPPNCPNGFPKAHGDTVYSPLYYGSAVLPDGRLVVIGGEYDYNYDYLQNEGDEFEVWSDQGAIYDPVANHWACIKAPAGWTQIGDAESVVLPDGTFMVAQPVGNQVATLNVGTNPPTFNPPFTPPGKSADDGGFNDEEGWTLLPDGTVLTTELWNSDDLTETPALTYQPSSNSWTSAGIAPDPLVLIKKGGTDYFEIGPALLRPDGTVFNAGATGFNDIYNTNNGVWTSGPTFPTITDTYTGCTLSSSTQQLVAADAPAALLPDGNVLVAASPIDATCGWVPPTEFFEFDGTGLTQVAEPPLGPLLPSYLGRLLVLPTGQVMFTDFDSDIELYTPVGTADPSWAPAISTSPAQVAAGSTDYQLTGTQFNGLSQAVAYGDDYQAATNYPLVRITNDATGHVFYARTHGHSSMAVATGDATVSTTFDVPGGIELGSSSLVVVANGIPSAPASVLVSSPAPTPGTLAVTPLGLSFKNAGTATTVTKTLTVKNVAKSGVLTGSVPAGSAPFTVIAGNGPFNLAAGAVASLTVQFAPVTAGPASATLLIASNDPKHPSISVKLTGTGVPGTLSVPSRLVFLKLKPQALDTAVTASFTIKNTGAGVLHGDVGAPTGPFQVTAGSGAFTLAHLQTLPVTVQFTPLVQGPATGTLAITSDDPRHSTVNLTLTGTGQ